MYCWYQNTSLKKTHPRLIMFNGQMLKLWTVRVDTGEGKELYGEDYADIWAINRLHFKAASHYECDHVSFRLALTECLKQAILDALILLFMVVWRRIGGGGVNTASVCSPAVATAIRE